jgi:hypothetical protein
LFALFFGFSLVSETRESTKMCCFGFSFFVFLNFVPWKKENEMNKHKQNTKHEPKACVFLILRKPRKSVQN